MKRARLLLVDDHTLLREGLAALINGQPDMEVAGEARDGLEAIVMARQIEPDLILMDIQMPGTDGLEALLQIKRRAPKMIVIMLTVQSDEEKLLQAIKYGAQGYLLKDMHSDDVIKMIRGALKGEAALHPALAGLILEEFRKLSRQPEAAAPAEIETLTPREQEVLAQVALGAADKEIAAALNISLYTVKSHIRNILAKLQVNSRHEAARHARHRGMI